MSVDSYLNKTGLIFFFNKLKTTFAPNKIVTGATTSTNGKTGLVPSPLAGDQNKCLLGDGTYGYPDIISDDDSYESLETEV